jgi:hypothetical protein
MNGDIPERVPRRDYNRSGDGKVRVQIVLTDGAPVAEEIATVLLRDGKV